MKQEKNKRSVIRLLLSGTSVFIAFFSIALFNLAIRFPIKQNVVIVFLVTILLLFLVIFLTLKRKYQFAKFLIVLAPPYCVFLISILTKTDGILDNVLVYLAHRFFTLTYLIAPVIFFGLGRKKSMLLSFFLLLPAALFFDYVHAYFGVQLAELAFMHEYYPFFNFMVILIYSFAIASVLLFQQTSISFKRKIVSQSQEIENQEKILRKALFNLNQSIEHAKLIQSSLIPDQDTLNSLFKDIGVLYMPKDQVSGDFYFAQKVKSVKYFGIGDCTGHGVPGAFLANMSIESIRILLNNSIEPIMPNQLLEELRKIATERFINSQANLTDSMDSGICMYNEAENTLHFSGGFINLMLLRNNSELIVYSGTRCPVGSYPVEIPYELHLIKVQKGDIVYLTSDGYYDQFGFSDYPNSRRATKFKKNRFKDLILSISHLSSDKQVDLLKEQFYSWKGDEDQTDDVTVLVAKL